MEFIMEAELNYEEECFNRACHQLNLLDHKLDSLFVRYKRAYADKNKAYYHSLRFQLVSVEGVRRYYYIYCRRKAHVISRLQKELYGEGVDVSELVEDPPSDEEDIY